MAISRVSLALFVVFAGLLAITFYQNVESVSSKQPQPITFGERKSTNIFPSEITKSDWSNTEKVLSQDLSEDALYQDFTAVNSGYIPKFEIVLPANTGTQDDSSSMSSSSEQAVTAEQLNESDEVGQTEAVIAEQDPVESNIDSSEPESNQDAEVSDDTSTSTVSMFRVTTPAQVFYPLANLIYTTTTNTSTPAVADTLQAELLDESDNVTPDLDTPDPLPTTATTTDEVETPTTIEESVSTSTTENPDVFKTPESEIVSTSTSATSSEPSLDDAVQQTIKHSSTVHEMILSDFGTVPLAPGEMVTGMQLRMSFAAQLEGTLVTDMRAPQLEVLFGADGRYRKVGSVIIDDEVSNALNGGYFLFALPNETSLDSLASSSVIIRYLGEPDTLDGIFLDAAWVELDTRIVTDTDFEKRGEFGQLDHIEGPELSSLVSSKINFERSETPVFNLRYNSQRNPLVRGFRSIVGSDLVKVEQVFFRHNSEGLIGVTPNINVTTDGLISIDVPDVELNKMPPGQYSVEIVYNEGGMLVEDSFDFQWGIITINPSKSEYETGELANISIGALTPNGHTICKADFNLFITDPDGYITMPTVTESGLCDGNNVIDVPDFSATASTTVAGTYKLYLERLGENGEVVGFTNDTFLVRDDQSLSIERTGPTRIYPPSPYVMELVVSSEDAYQGVVTERVPLSFTIASTTADISIEGDHQVLTWDLNLLSGGNKTLSYSFDAPDLSPFLFNLGPAAITGDYNENQSSLSASTSSSTSALRSNVFVEHREWQIASDAVGNMILFWDDGASIPTDWTCLSCGSGTFFQRFVMGSSTYNTTGGAATHTHTAGGSVRAATETGGESGSGGASPISHGHSYTPVISAENNLPEYRQLRVIQYTAAAGEPTTIPSGAIAMFDVASSSLPANWNRYAAQDGRYAYGEDTPGTTGGSNTHAHTVTGTTGAGTGAGTRSRGGVQNGALSSHTHTVSTSTATVSNEPPYIEVLFAQASAAVSPSNGIIAMWTEDVDSGWLDISSNDGDPFNQRFIKASTTYGGTGGAASHSHADIIDIVSSGPSATDNTVDGASGASDTHTHPVDVTGFSDDSNLPPYLTAVFGKRQGTDPVYEQVSSRWYANGESELPPTDPWPVGAGTDLIEQEPITATSTPVKTDDLVRVRMNIGVSNATSTAGSDFKLQYAAADVCSAAGSWIDVGSATSSAIWRGYDNSGLTDSTTLSSTTLASSTIFGTYEENGFASSTPNEIPVGDFGEFDFVLQHNGAAPGTNYCFRLVERDDTVFFNYTHYPQLYTNEAPTAPVQDKLFDNEKTASTSPWFYFTSSDTEGDKVHYQIQIDDAADFASTVVDRDTIDDSSLFENQIIISDKAPFRESDQIEFIPSTSLTNGTTYYWRVRGQDPEGSQEWGDWSTTRSFTIDTSLTASAWFQTETEQFDTNTLTGVDTASNQSDLITGSTTGTMVSSAITFTDGELGTAWDNLSFSETDGSNVLDYQIEFFDGSSWALIPDADLAGNSTGFGTSPVSLIDLDVGTYGIIRVIADFTANTGTPSLQDWTVNWGFRVETPTITSLFSNEQVGTTTPTFEFVTTDPQDDSLTYQIQWSETPDFAASTTRTSDTDAGFVNIGDGLDTDPFDSGEAIQFTIQPADALNGTTTYWWRVRAKDTTGDDAYSFWTDERSFTVIPGTEVSTWFQTTEEQFDTDILSGTLALGTDLVTVATSATEAMMVYGEGTDTTPKYRQWDGSSLSSQSDMQDVAAPITWAIVQAGTTREEYVAATLGTDADVNVQVFANGVWDDLQEVTTSVSDISARGFDVAYETISGDAMVAYCDGDADPSYYLWDGTSWTSGGTINVTETTDCTWLQLASDPTSDEIIVVVRGSDGNPYEAQVWNATTSTWGDAVTLGRITESSFEGMAVEYEESGGQALVIASDGNPARFTWESWDGAAWAGASTQTIGNDFEWGSLVRDIGTDEMALCLVDDTSDIAVVRWSGAAWTLDDNLETASTKTEPGFSCIYEDSASRDNYILLTYSDAAATNYQTNDTTAWSVEAQVNSIVNTATQQLARTGDTTILGTFFDDANDTLRFSTWNGSVWSTTDALTTDASVNSSPYGEPYSMAARNSNTEGTVIVSPELDFDDGTGPYWQEFSWNDTQSGSSEIRYFLQYQTATGSWAFIPSADLPDNDTGTTTGPYDLSNLNTVTYNVIRPYAELTCDGGGVCPELLDWKIEWAGGITVSGTIDEYDQTTAVNSGSVAVAVNGVLQTGKTGTIAGGNWSIDNVTTFPGDVVTVFVTGAADTNEAVGVTRYDGQGDMSGIALFERHLSLGSNDATTTPITNADIGLYDFTNTEDIFSNVIGSVLEVCADSGCFDAELYIASSTFYTPNGTVVTHDIENTGTFTATGTVEVNGSWVNTGTTTMTDSTVIFAATSTAEGIDSTGAISSAFNNVLFGTTTGNGTWTPSSTLDIDGDITVSRGTLARASTSITVAGNLLTEANGFWTGIGTTTFDGGVGATWGDQNGTLQNIGYVVIDGSSKIVTLSDNVAAQSIEIGSDDTFDVSVSNYSATVYGDWNNQNNFVARSGLVILAATTTGAQITTNGDAFFDLTFNGIGGAWSYTESETTIDNDLTIATGTVTLPNVGTTTIAGSFDATGGSFLNNNGVLYFTSNAAETITFDGDLFTNVAYDMRFNGGGSWAMNDVNATSTNDVFVEQGTVTFPSGVLAIGGTLTDSGGTFSGGTGTVLFYSALSEVITAGGSSFNSVEFDGAGSWSFADTDVTMTENLFVDQGTVTLPSDTLTIGGSYTNTDTVTSGTGTVLFDSTDTGETVDLGNSTLHNMTFDSTSGGWTVVASATTTGSTTIANADTWVLQSGEALSVSGVFTNSVGGASTTWTGTTLSLESGNYAINTKTDNGDSYENLRIAAAADISMWNSVAVSYDVDPSGSLYSQDHNGLDGDLYIWGAYENTSGGEYWTYDTDFDGADLVASSSERQVDVRFADGASAALTDSIFEIGGEASATTTIADQVLGTYIVTVSGGTTTAQYYDFDDLGASGLSLLDSAVVTTLADGSYDVGVAAGSALTLSSTTIDVDPAKQIFNVTFSTSSAIAANNVSQTDGTPTSFWWFRNGTGNLYGESFDNDTGDPGSVRFDDSSLVLTISGTVYSDAGVTPIVGGTCDNATQVVRVVVDGGTSYTGSCSNVDGSYSVGGVVVVGDPTLTVYLDNASGGERAAAITRTPTADITDLDLYANRVIVRNEDTQPLTIANLATYDQSDDTDLQFVAATSSDPDSLTVLSGNGLFVASSSDFTPGGTVTLNANAEANEYDGSLYIADNAVFTGAGTTTYTIGGSLTIATNASFTPASSTVLFNATTTGKTINASSTIDFYDLTFDGAGGAWNLQTDIEVANDMLITNGTLSGVGDITLPSGSLTGNGILDMSAGTTTIASSTSLGGSSAWTFHNLQLGDTFIIGTTTPLFTSTTTIGGVLTIESAHFLDAGSSTWDLAGTGNVFVENGTFVEDTSTIRYSGAGSNVLSTQYYNLDINAAAGPQTYTATGLGIIVDNNLTVGGAADTTFDLNANDPAFDVNGDVIVMSNGTLETSDTANFTIAGSYDNDGALTSNAGTLTFDGAGTIGIAAGSGNFGNIIIDATGDVIISEHASTSNDFRLLNANSFTVSSGESLSVTGMFLNDLGGAATTWTNTTLRLIGGDDYSINTATTSDSYATIDIGANTQIRMWNSDALTYSVFSSGSLYSQDHANIDGDLYIWGAYTKASANDYWSYATDFDGTDLTGGSERKVDVYLATSSQVTITGGVLEVVGDSAASTTVQAQSTDEYGITIGGTASTTWNYYEVRDIDATGLELTGTADVNDLSFGDLEVSVNGGTAITVGGTVIDANPAQNFTVNRFALNGVASGFNVTATGTSVSSWRFANHYGDIDGEANDVDPDGDPGYIAWDDSAALITVSGTVYSDEGSTTSAVCDGSTNNVLLRVAGITTYTTSCNATTGAYSITNVSYGTSDSLVVYIDGETEQGATATKEPVSNIGNLDIYEDRVIVRHENVNAIDIADMAVWDSSDDADIPFTAVDAGTDTLTLPADTKLIVWNGKEFEPGGDVTISGGGAGAAYDGSLQLFDNAQWTGQGTESLSVGGSMVLDTDAVFTASNGTTTFTTSGAARTIDVNEDSFNNVAFTGSGSWTFSDPTLNTDGDVSISSGAVTLPTGTSTISGSFINSGGSFVASGGVLLLDGASTHTITAGGSDLSELQISNGTYTFGDVNATTTGSTTINSGSLTLPSGTLAVGGDFTVDDGSIAHNTSELILTNSSAASLTASSSDLFAVTFSGGGVYTMVDESATLLDSLVINSGSVTLSSTTLSIGGSFDATGGTFTAASNTVQFNSSDTGEIIDPGTSSFYNVLVSAPSGGYTITGNATTTNNFTLSNATSFTLGSGNVLKVEGVFINSVGGTNTTWAGSTLALDGENAYTINTKAAGGDQYENVIIGSDSDIRSWNSAATSTTVDASSSLYSQDHASIDGELYIFGDFHIGTTTEYWSYATDFDGTDISGGSERVVTVAHAENATTTVDGGTLNIIGESGNETTITNQGSGTYAMAVSAGTFNAQYYAYRNLNITGLDLSGTPLITSLSFGDFELAVDSGNLISLSSTTLNANASLIITGNRFATTTAITGNNVNLNGTTPSAWTFVGHTGNLDGEDYDVDGVDACSSVRWDDSACLLTQQIEYRWRNDDGGIGVPADEWYDTDWDARKRVRVQNDDATTYTNAAVQMFVDYDSDMQSDFDDLRFTDASGTNTLSYWVGSTTASVQAEVWVEIPSLPASDTTTLFMYYNNPSAISSASSTGTFIAADDFEDGDIAEYSGETVDFTVDSSFGFGTSNGLDATGNETGRTESGGMYRLDQTVSQGETIRFKQFLTISGGVTDETCTKFGIQSTDAPDDNYAVCVDLNGTDRLVLARDAVDNADTSPATTLDSKNITTATGWHNFEVEWGTDDSIFVTMTDDSGTLVATTSATDSNYSSGGYGFSFWFQSGGWDEFTSRPTLTTEPTVLFGVEQTDGGASWKAAQNTAATYDVGDIARVRFVVENTGLAITNQQFLLEYAEQGVAPSCEAVDASEFATVPVQSSCGSSPICMIGSGNITNGAATVDLLDVADSTFTPGEVREDPSNVTNNLDLDQDEYTELEYAITPTINVSDQSLCFRVTDNGSDYDTYLRVANMVLRFDPTVGSITLNEAVDISLLPGTTTQVYATGTVTDLNGFADLTISTTTFYRSGVAGGASCTADNNNCYISSGSPQCEFTDCLGNSCTVACYADFLFHADATDTGSSFDGQEWFAFVEVEDAAGGVGFNTSIGQEVNTLRAIDVEGPIDYGTLAVNDDTGANNASTSISNEGNTEVNVEIQGTDLSDGFASVIPSTQQKFSTTTFTYASCGAVCNLLSSTTATELDVELTKPTTDSPPVEDDVYWGVAVPFGVSSAAHQGTNVFTAVSP